MKSKYSKFRIQIEDFTHVNTYYARSNAYYAVKMYVIHIMIYIMHVIIKVSFKRRDLILNIKIVNLIYVIPT